MAKVAFSKLGLKINTEVHIIAYNDQNIEVKQYLPIDKKLELLANVVNNSITDKGFYNECKVRVLFALEMVYAYTNISITDKQKEDTGKLYDLLNSSSMLNMILKVIPQSEIDFLEGCLEKIIKSVYDYNNSVAGIMENMSNDYDGLHLDAQSIQQLLSDPENMSLLRDVLSKLG